MAVHRVNEYFILMKELQLTEENKAGIKKLLGAENYSRYEFLEDDTCLCVERIFNEHRAYTLESQIKEIL